MLAKSREIQTTRQTCRTSVANTFTEIRGSVVTEHVASSALQFCALRRIGHRAYPLGSERIPGCEIACHWRLHEKLVPTTYSRTNWTRSVPGLTGLSSGSLSSDNTSCSEPEGSPLSPLVIDRCLHSVLAEERGAYSMALVVG